MIYHSQKTRSIILTYIFVAQLGVIVIIPLMMLLMRGASKLTVESTSLMTSFLIGLGIILFLIRNELKEMKSEKKDWKKIILYGLLGFLVALVLQTVLNPVIYLLTNGGEAANDNELAIRDMTQANWIFILVPTIIGPILEEIVFRYAILGSLMKRMKTPYAVAISSILFGLAHFSLVNLIVHVSIGVIFSVIYLRSKSLAAPIIAHVLMNGFVLALYLLGIN
jgi:uncharacterized protein